MTVDDYLGGKPGIEIAILRHADVLIGNAALGAKSRLRREGMNKARMILKELIGIRMDATLKAMNAEAKREAQDGR